MVASLPPPSYSDSANPEPDYRVVAVPPSGSDEKKAALESASRELDRRVVLYNDARARTEAEPANAAHQEAYTRAAADVAACMRRVADAHPDEGTGGEWRARADGFARASPRERDNALGEVGRGILAIVATPFVLAGLAIYGAGVVVGGVGSVLKGMGKFGVAALKSKRASSRRDGV